MSLRQAILPACLNNTGDSMEIVTNTPIWVWCVLLCLLYVGSKQSKTRQIKPYKLTFLPLIFLPIVIMSIMQSHHPLIAGFGFIVGLALGLFFRVDNLEGCPFVTKTRATVDTKRKLSSAYPVLIHFYF